MKQRNKGGTKGTVLICFNFFVELCIQLYKKFTKITSLLLKRITNDKIVPNKVEYRDNENVKKGGIMGKVGWTLEQQDAIYEKGSNVLVAAAAREW